MPFFLIVFFFSGVGLFSQTIDLDSALAEETFRNGVNAFQNGLLNKAYVNFEQAISLKPDRPLYSYWLAESYYRNGYNSAAGDVWKQLIERGYEIDLLKSRVEQVRRALAPVSSIVNSDYALSMEIEGKRDGLYHFAAPIALSPDKKGGLWTTSYATGQILYFNANGKMEHFHINGVRPFNRIYDFLISEEGHFYASEMGKDRLFHFDAQLNKLAVFGSKGREKSQFNGPQFIAQDKGGYLYVSDVGNKRIVKYSKEGEALLSFGSPHRDFPGLRLPTGVVSVDKMVVVADGRDKVLYLFDESGNYLGESGRGKFHGPEGMRAINNREILIADTDRIVLFDLEMESIHLISDLNGLGKKVVNVAVDINGNIVASDFNKNSIYYLTDRSLIYSGLYIQVEKVNSEKFPNVAVDFTVKDSLGRPFCGLDQSNFILVEQGAMVEKPQLRYADVESQEVSVVLLMDRSSEVLQSRKVMETTMKRLFNDLQKGDRFFLVSEDVQPLLQDSIFFHKKKDVAQIESFLDSIFSPKTPPDENGRFDLALRESVNRLLPYRGRKAVVYISDGKLDKEDFKEYNLTRLENFLENNQISFYFVQMVPQKNRGVEELHYLVEKTGGKNFSAFSPTGVQDLIPTIRSGRSGRYVLEYHSKTPDNFGRDYIELSIEVSHFNRTGRTLFGYYSPLDFKR